MDRFSLIIAVAIVGVLLAGCGDEYVCPNGTASERGRCRLVGPDGIDADAFVWPPVDTAIDLGAPVPFRPDATAGPDGTLPDGAAPDDAAVPDDAGSDGGPGDGGAGDTTATDGGAEDATTASDATAPDTTDDASP